MSTNRVNPASTLYKGHNKRPLGELIYDMARSGRKVPKEQLPRWKENRAFYRGEQMVRANPSSSQIRSFTSLTYPRQREQETFNLLRYHVDSRVALLTREKPPFEVEPEDHDQDSIDGARMATKIIEAHWGQRGWRIKERLVELTRAAEIDGVAYLYVDWDPYAGPADDHPIAINIQTGQPVTDRQEYEALKEQDPQMTSLWRMMPNPTGRPVGDVCWRVVRADALAVDPLAVSDFTEARWTCETRVRPREEVEEEAGMDLKEMIRRSKASMGIYSDSARVSAEQDITVDHLDGSSSLLTSRDAVLVNYFYIRPSKDWPRGAYVKVCDLAPGEPLAAQPYPHHELPYVPYMPAPDGGHFIKSRGTVDEVKPIQRQTNRTHSQLSAYMDRVATLQMVLERGQVQGDSVFNKDGILFVNPGFNPPTALNVPGEPTGIATNYLATLEDIAQRISGVSDPARGFAPGHGAEAGVTLNLLVQQTEQSMSVSEANLVAAIEWGCGRSLQLVGRKYTTPRAVVGLGVDSANEFRAFEGAMLRGSHRFRVTGTVLPRSKAAQAAALQQYLPFIGPQIQPYLVKLLTGDQNAMDELAQEQELDRQRQREENRDIANVATNQQAIAIWQNFEADKQAFAQAAQRAQLIAQTTGVSPIAVLANDGILPPNLTDMLRSAGIQVPQPEDCDDPFIHIAEVNRARKSDGARRWHPLVHQLMREHKDAHVQAAGQQMAGMAVQSPMGQQQGSQPADKGTPSPPKQQAQQNGAAGSSPAQLPRL